MNINGQTLKNNHQFEGLSANEREAFELRILELFEHYWYERLYCADNELAETMRYLRHLVKQLRVIEYAKEKLHHAQT